VNSIQNVGTQPLAITATGLLTPWMDPVRQRLQRDTVMETVITSSPDSQPDDAAILASIARKDRQAFHQLYDRYAPIALGLAVRVLNDKAAGEDVLQEAFMRVWHHADKFDPTRGNARSWLLTVVHRLAIDALRRRQARPAVQLDAPENEDWDLPDEEANVHDTVLASLSQTQVRQALHGLNKDMRQVVELSYYKGMSHREIAAHLNEPLGTIHSRARQAILQLRKVLWETVAG
jgi:RNA polymerase sigma-70 factor, ECF subfamily